PAGKLPKAILTIVALRLSPARPPVDKSCTLGWRRHRYSWVFPNSAQNAPNCSSSLFHCSPSEPTRHRPPFRTPRVDFRPWRHDNTVRQRKRSYFDGGEEIPRGLSGEVLHRQFSFVARM